MSSLRASIALCTYNGERYLAEQLESLLAQTRLPDEIVIRDDVSSDGTWAILQDFASRAYKAGVAVDLQQNAVNLGYVRNFESALCASSGEVVFLCDQDDVWHEQKVAKMMLEFERRADLLLLHTDADLVGLSGQKLGMTLFQVLEVSSFELSEERAGRAFEVLLRRNLVTGATIAIRRSVLTGILPTPAGWVHDEWIAFASSVQGRVDHLPWFSIGYRQHETNQIGVKKRTSREKLLRTGMPKRKFMQHVASRLERALDHLDASGVVISEAVRERIQERIEHARLRAELPRGFISRCEVVMSEVPSKRYWAYSSGWRSIASDLLDMG